MTKSQRTTRLLPETRFTLAASEFVQYCGAPIAVTLMFWISGTGKATLLQSVLAYALLQVAWGYWVYWKKKPAEEKHFPLFSAIAGMYWLAYAMPLFWSAENYRAARPLTESAMTRSLALALVALVCLFAGMHLGVFRWVRRAPTLDLRETPASPTYVATVLLIGPLLNYFPIVWFFGGGLRQAMIILRTTVPLAACAILLRRRLLRPVPPFERLALVLFVAVTVGFGLASGWIGAGAAVMVTAGCVLVDTRFKIPKAALALALLYIVFLQPAKEQFRMTYWGKEGDTSASQRAGDWLSTALRRWEGTLTDSNPTALRDTLYTVVSRFSLLQQTANVMEITPDLIPYQGSFMYRYLAVTLIPRVLWPDKPSVNEANRFYQVTYGMTAERNLENTSIAVGMPTESYIAYGWAGVVVIMTLTGVLLDGVASVCLARDAGVLMKGIGMALMPMLASVESQMAVYLGGLIQHTLLTIAVMVPIIHVRRGSQRVPSGMAGGVPWRGSPSGPPPEPPPVLPGQRPGWSIR